MKLLLDADIHRSFLHRLKNQGHDVVDARDISRVLLKALQTPQEQLQGTLVIVQKDRLRFHK